MDLSIRSRRSALAALACPALLSPLAPSWALAQAGAPPALVGAWSGTWSAVARPGLTGAYTLTITSVDGTQVTGQIERAGATTTTADLVGTLDKGKLTIVGATGTTELTVNGTRMRGHAFGTDHFDIALTKR